MLDFIKEKTTCWEHLQKSEIPIFMYGMGDGALKIMSVMQEHKIPLSGFFASDEYVRGHFFEQHKVHSLAEIEGILDAFVIVLAFAANYPALIEKINNLSHRHPLFAPDVPVAGEGLFTYKYCEENAEKIEQVYSLLADEKSRQVFADILNFKISGKISYLDTAATPRAEVFENLLHLGKNEVYVDLGAYNGDTVEEFLQQTHKQYSEILALEPDRRNFKKLLKAVDKKPNIRALNAAAWEEDTVLRFADKAGRQSALSEKGTEVRAARVDSLLAGKPCSLLKMDVEGAEKSAILGAADTIRKFSPKLMISLYHRNEDLFELPLLIHSLNPSYKLYIRHQPYIPAWETNLYAVP